jgi:hypothetical protein
MSFFLFLLFNCIATLIYSLKVDGFQAIGYVTRGHWITTFIVASLITALLSSEKITTRFQITKSMAIAAAVSALAFTIGLMVFDFSYAVRFVGWL